MSNLAYSEWHRTLGYSFFAMDIDYIEVRDNNAVAVIEASLCTNKFKECEGADGVFNRFLRETGGFQLDMAYWVSKWLEVPSFIVCLNPNSFSEKSSTGKETIQVLSLNTGEEVIFTLNEYKEFISSLPNTSPHFSQHDIELPDLLEKMILKYPGLASYPYFKFKRHRKSWNETYLQRNTEIKNRITKKKLNEVPENSEFPVKGETTHERPATYEAVRSSIGLDYINLEWVEWRKEYKYQPIGRPAALIKTIEIDYINEKEFKQLSMNEFLTFKTSVEYDTWCNLAQKMCVDWFYVAYSVNEGVINENSRFMVWKGGEKEGYVTSLQGYTDFLKKR